jgi:hypothetical protein
MCSCNRSEPRRARTANTTATIVRNAQTVNTNIPAPPPTVVGSIQSMDPDRLRVEQLRRAAIRRAFGG